MAAVAGPLISYYSGGNFGGSFFPQSWVNLLVMKRPVKRIVIQLTVTFCAGLLASACTTVGPEYVQPEAPLPDAWQTSPAGLKATEYELVDWWEAFDDPILDDLVNLAHQQNLTLELAGLRVLESRAQLGIATGAQYPQQQAASGGATHISPSENAGQGTTSFNQVDLGVGLVWELDFWGRYRRGIESADAAMMASIANYDSVMVLVTAQVVDTYIVIRTLEEQLHIAQENLKLQKRSYDIADVLYRNGESNELDVQQALTLLLSTQATVPQFQVQERLAKNAMSTLLGQPSSYVDDILGTGEIPSVPAEIALGIPADLLRRRPDVRQAELQAVAQNALVGVATADLYPSIAINGTFGIVSISKDVGGGGASDLFSSDSISYTAGAAFSWPILNYGRIRNNIRVQDARLQQALVNYQDVVLKAARETDDAIVSLAGTQEQEPILADSVEAAKRSNDLSLLRYQEGFSGYQRVLDSQQALFRQQNSYVQNRGLSARNVVAIYKALGGGWEVRQGRAFVDENTLTVMRERTNWGSLLDSPAEEETSEDGMRRPDW
jgi:NodT family efflux transporter outer membrane factor (OMF) lipoprotein